MTDPSLRDDGDESPSRSTDGTEQYADVSEAFAACPVCGWGVVRKEGVPENPDPDHPPDTYGTFYVHEIRATGNGRFEVAGCTEYANGETEAWEP